MNSEEPTKIIAADFMYLVFLGDNDIIGRLVEKLNKNFNDSINNNINNNNYNSNKYKSGKQFKSIYIKHDICTPCIEMLESEQIQTILKEDAINQIKKQRLSRLSTVTTTSLTTSSTLLTENKRTIINDDDIDTQKKYVVPDEGVESTQCLTYADVSCTEKNVSKHKTQIKNLMMLMVMNDTGTHYKLSFPILQLDEEENPDRLISRWLKEHDIEDLIKELTIRLVNIVGNEHEILVFTAFVNE